jgi:hypothetical protein
MVRLNGCAAFGAVDVLGGAANVRDPREPELLPPPTRASADEIAIVNGIASDRTTAIVLTTPRMLNVKVMVIPQSPAGGSVSNMAMLHEKGSGLRDAWLRPSVAAIVTLISNTYAASQGECAFATQGGFAIEAF